MKAIQHIKETHTIHISVAEIMEEYDLPDTLIPKSARLAIGAPGAIVIEFEDAECQTIEHDYVQSSFFENGKIKKEVIKP